MQDSAAVNEDTDGEETEESCFTFKSIKLRSKDVTDNGVLCPLCTTNQKRFIHHMKKMHKESLDRAEKAFENKCKNFLHSLRQQRYKGRQDPSQFAEKGRQKQKKSRKKLKEENPEKVKANRRRAWRRYRYGEDLPNAYYYHCSSCWKKPALSVIKTPAMKKALKTKAVESVQRAQSADISTFHQEQTKEWTQMSTVCEELSKNRKEEAETESEAEFVGTWEGESDLEDEVDWKLIHPQWLLPWTADWRDECDRIKKMVQWNIEHGTRDEDTRLRWKLCKVDKYIDWLWFDVLKMLKAQEGATETASKTEKEKQSLVEQKIEQFRHLLSVGTWLILNRFCETCPRANME